jgi:hypothetical protein
MTVQHLQRGFVQMQVLFSMRKRHLSSPAGKRVCSDDGRQRCKHRPVSSKSDGSEIHRLLTISRRNPCRSDTWSACSLNRLRKLHWSRRISTVVGRTYNTCMEVASSLCRRSPLNATYIFASQPNEQLTLGQLFKKYRREICEWVRIERIII